MNAQNPAAAASQQQPQYSSGQPAAARRQHSCTPSLHPNTRTLAGNRADAAAAANILHVSSHLDSGCRLKVSAAEPSISRFSKRSEHKERKGGGDRGALHGIVVEVQSLSPLGCSKAFGGG